MGDFSRCVILAWQRHHDCVQVLAHDFELADRLELHGLPGEVLLRRHRVGEDVQQEGAAAGRVHAERHHVPHHRLHHEPASKTDEAMKRENSNKFDVEIQTKDQSCLNPYWPIVKC